MLRYWHRLRELEIVDAIRWSVAAMALSTVAAIFVLGHRYEQFADYCMMTETARGPLAVTTAVVSAIPPLAVVIVSGASWSRKVLTGSVLTFALAGFWTWMLMPTDDCVGALVAALVV